MAPFKLEFVWPGGYAVPVLAVNGGLDIYTLGLDAFLVGVDHQGGGA